MVGTPSLVTREVVLDKILDGHVHGGVHDGLDDRPNLVGGPMNVGGVPQHDMDLAVVFTDLDPRDTPTGEVGGDLPEHAGMHVDDSGKCENGSDDDVSGLWPVGRLRPGGRSIWQAGRVARPRGGRKGH